MSAVDGRRRLGANNRLSSCYSERRRGQCGDNVIIVSLVNGVVCT